MRHLFIVLGWMIFAVVTVMVWERSRYNRWPWQIDRYIRGQERAEDTTQTDEGER